MPLYSGLDVVSLEHFFVALSHFFQFFNVLCTSEWPFPLEVPNLVQTWELLFLAGRFEDSRLPPSPVRIPLAEFEMNLQYYVETILEHPDMHGTKIGVITPPPINEIHSED